MWGSSALRARISEFRRPGVWVSSRATIVGEVTLGDGCSVWYGAVLRADTAPIRIGVDTNIQDNCVVHADPDAPVTVGDRVSVGHAAVLHGCEVEADVLIGMSATVLNHARIGQGSLVAAGAVIPQGMVVPPGSLVAGMPAVVRRPLTEPEQAEIRENAQRYRELAEAQLPRAKSRPWRTHPLVRARYLQG